MVKNGRKFENKYFSAIENPLSKFCSILKYLRAKDSVTSAGLTQY
jgi:hypothetical protein